MAPAVTPMWRRVPPDISRRVESVLDAALARRGGPVHVFFRADDAAVPGNALFRLTEIFASRRMPLNLAVVPAWLTATRWRALRRRTAAAEALFCWHQHGWRHVNHEPDGKKQEFGPARTPAAAAADLRRGKERLERLLERQFYPVFTPPWNRCGGPTLSLLKAMNFRAVSRGEQSRPEAPEGLPEIPVNVDLHTLKPEPATAWARLLEDLGRSVSGGVCGVMIHHRVMNDSAFGFLDTLLGIVAARPRLVPVTFRRLVEARP